MNVREAIHRECDTEQNRAPPRRRIDVRDQREQQTDRLDNVVQTLDGIPEHDGEDATQSAMEALYQALTGVGYDQDCDGSYDSSTDVKPFVSDATDPFRGGAGQFYNATDESTGTVGMGFH